MDQETILLLQIATRLRSHFVSQEDPWKASPFGWIRALPSRRVGRFAEELVAEWLRFHGFKVEPSPDIEADRLVDGYRVEIKFSTLWDNGTYRFQQLRDQNYDIVICLGISPHTAHCWAIPKKVVMQKWKEGLIPS